MANGDVVGLLDIMTITAADIGWCIVQPILLTCCTLFAHLCVKIAWPIDTVTHTCGGEAGGEAVQGTVPTSKCSGSC
jgi:hypothetical protein